MLKNCWLRFLSNIDLNLSIYLKTDSIFEIFAPKMTNTQKKLKKVFCIFMKDQKFF